MRVYVKKEEKNTMIPGLIVTILFLALPIGLFISIIKSGKTFIDVLSSLGITLILIILLFAFGLFFLYTLIKRPKGYKALLIDKKIETYNGKPITYMKFSTQKEKDKEDDLISSNYNCYTIGDNNLVVGNYYSLKIKEFNWTPKYVEDYESTKNKVASKIPNATMLPVYYLFEIFFIGAILLCIYGIIMYTEYTLIFILVGIFFGGALFKSTKLIQAWKENNNNIVQNEQDLNPELEKIKPINNIQEKVGNIVIKHLLILLVAFPIVWFMIILILHVEKESFMIAFSMISFIELLIIIMIIYNIGYDERLIKRHKVNISDNFSISDIKNFYIFRPTKNATFPQFFIVDQNKNLIFRIKKSNFIGNKFVICDPYNIKIGEIKSKLFSLTDEFVVNIINENPFIIRSKMELHSNYQVIGRDYYVKGDAQLIRNVICDNKENDIAYLSSVSKNKNWHELGNVEVILNDGVSNSIDIMLMALCIAMGNLEIFNRRVDR